MYQRSTSRSFLKSLKTFAVAFLAAAIVLFSAKFANAQAAESNETPFSKCWQLEIAGSLPKSPVAHGGLVILPERGGKLSAIDETDGLTVWSTELGGELASNLFVIGDALYVVSIATGATSGDATLRAVEAKSGVVRSSMSISRAGSFTLGASAKNLIVVSSTGEMRSVSHDLEQITWTTELGSAMSRAPAIADAVSAVVSPDRSLRAIDLKTGDSIGQIRWEHDITAVAVADDGSVIFGDERGVIARFDPVTGSVIWKYKTGGALTFVSANSSSVIGTSNDNFVYQFDKGAGSVRWRKRLTGRAAHGPIVFGDNVIVASVGDGSIPIISANTGSLVNRIELGDRNSISFDPMVTEAGRYIFTSGGFISAFSQAACVAK